MSPGVTAAVLGALAGLAIMCVIVALIRPAPVNLAAALAELDDRIARHADGAPPRGRWLARLERLADLSARSSSRWWGIPAADLDVLGQTPERYLARRLAWAGGATAGVLAGAGVVWLGGIGLPTTVVLAVMM